MKKFKLKNGLSVVIFPRKSPISAFSLSVKVGSHHENKKIEGISHFIEHMVFEGTKKRSALEISSAIEGIGGEIGAYTSNERTCFYVKGLSRYSEKSLDVLSDIAFNPNFDEKSIEKERKIIISEILMRKDEPRYHQWDIFLETLFKGFPPGHSTSGSEDSVNNISREDLIMFHRNAYVPKNMILSVVGEVTKKEIEKYFGIEKEGKPIKVSFKTPLLKKAITKKVKKDIQQSYLVLGYRTVPLTHGDSCVLEVIRAILGKGMSGRLFDEIRNKKGLAYDVGCHHEKGIQYGFFACYVSSEKLKECEKIIKKEIQRAYEISDKELVEAQNYLEGEFVFHKEDSEKWADAIGVWDQAEKLEYAKSYIPSIRKVTKKDIKRVTKKYFSAPPAKVILGKLV